MGNENSQLSSLPRLLAALGGLLLLLDALAGSFVLALGTAAQALDELADRRGGRRGWCKPVTRPKCLRYHESVGGDREDRIDAFSAF